MTRQYLCSVVGDGTGTELRDNAFRASISDLLNDLRIDFGVLDLRTLEEQSVSRTGKMLVTLDEEPTQFIHDQIMSGGDAVPFTRATSKAEIVAIIGDEASTEIFTLNAPEDFLKRVHSKRRDRYVRER